MRYVFWKSRKTCYCLLQIVGGALWGKCCGPVRLPLHRVRQVISLISIAELMANSISIAPGIQTCTPVLFHPKDKCVVIRIVSLTLKATSTISRQQHFQIVFLFKNNKT